MIKFSQFITEADKALTKKAEKSGISYGTLKKVYDRGVAAWRTGHRPGTTPSQWGYAQVNAFIAYIHGRPCNQFFYFMLTLAAKRAVKKLFICILFITHKFCA